VVCGGFACLPLVSISVLVCCQNSNRFGMNTRTDFTFLVLAYNHEDYILEHLESIKYLIEKYGDEVSVDLIIADDASRDRTVEVADCWLRKNADLFRRTVILSDGVNRGTCKNLTRAIEELSTEYCKITAGDDVYSYENIFAESKQIDGREIVSGLPLHLIDGVIGMGGFYLFNLFATNVVYENASFLKRLKGVGFFNSPSVIYAVPALLNRRVIEFVNQYSVTEDYPLQVKIAELYSPMRFAQIEKIFVYYRRTAGSAYIVKTGEFNQDKEGILRYLIGTESGLWPRILLANRLFCCGVKNKYLRLMLNINVYVYALRVVWGGGKVVAKYLNFDSQVERHQAHYDLISYRAKHSIGFVGARSAEG